MFVNRDKELESLNSDYNKSNSSFSVIYGRRRVGKTALISKFISDKPAIYFYATESKLNQQLEILTSDIVKFFNKEYLKDIKFKGFEQFFIFLSDNLPNDKKIVFVIDEYQNLAKIDKSFSSILQRVWDLHLKDKKIHLILCGSVISMMYSETLSYNSPLYGRRTSNIHLKALAFEYIKSFIPTNKIDLMNIYASFGTIPKYLEMYDKNKSFFENVKTEMLNPNSYLYQEGKFLLKEEINDITTYFSILEVISQGESKIGNIAKRLSVHSSYLTRYLEKLIDLDIIEKEVPITEKNPSKSKLGRYRIKDNFLKFWFFYIYKNYSYLEIERVDYVLSEIEVSFNEKFVSFAFEDYVKELLTSNPLEYLGYYPKKLGRWWSNKEEIDLIAIGEEKITFIECKWKSQKVGYDVYHNLVEKSKLIESDLEREYVVFSKSGFKSSIDDAENLKLFTY